MHCIHLHLLQLQCGQAQGASVHHRSDWLRYLQQPQPAADTAHLAVHAAELQQHSNFIYAAESVVCTCNRPGGQQAGVSGLINAGAASSRRGAPEG